MTAIMSSLTKATAEQLLPPAARTATANGTGLDCERFDGVAMAVLDSAAGTGTAPTLDIKLQHSADNSTFVDITGAVFTQVGAAAAQQLLRVDLGAARRYLRAVSTIGGTTPSFTCNLSLIALPKY